MPKTMHVASPARPKPQITESHPTREVIQLRAYEIYLERGGAPGNELEDWLRAERELLQKYSQSYQKTARAAKAQAA